MKKVEIGKHSKVNIKWSVLPIDYSHEGEKEIISKFARKYGIPKENVSVEPVFINEKGETGDSVYVNESVQNIQDPEFKYGLFKQYLAEKNIEDYDFEKIVELDKLITSNIDYEVYDKHKRYTIKWIKWSNFMSFGKDNFFDFTKLSGLVLLSSEPANQGGKTTFCLDLFRFLLFGKVTSRESDWTLSKVFNDYMPEATEVVVEGCIEIDGVDYVIKRVVSRPDLKRRTERSKVSQKVTYYKLVGGQYVDLEDEDSENETESSGTETNKSIKEAIGNERDFDLMICVDSTNLKGLISLKDTDRGRLITRWIGLLVLEDTDKLAREYYNKSVAPKLTLNKYNKEDLKADNAELEESNEESVKEGVKYKKDKEDSEKKLNDYKEKRDILLSSKLPIDDELTKTDKVTVERKRDDIIEAGKRKAAEKERNEKAYNDLKDVQFDNTKYKEAILEDKELSIEANNLKNDVERLENEIKQLKDGEYCPMCGSKLKDVDNTELIEAKTALVEKTKKKIKKANSDLEKVGKLIEKMEVDKADYDEKTKLGLIIDKNEVDIENYRAKLRECNRILKDLENNDAAIRKNNEINAKINVIDASVDAENKVHEELERKLEELRADIIANRKIIADNKKLIAIIEEEEKLVRNWKIYLEMIGKNGISKMVLRKALPIINGDLKRMLSDVCDFDVEVAIDDHNDVAFYQIHNGVKRNLAAGSGFEQTAASLALRSVLSKISTFSKPSFVVFDEILGGVADENYDQMKLLYDKIVKDYACIIQITHLKSIADWHNQHIIVKKENDISRIEMA